MEGYAKNFIRIALVTLILGLLFGLAMVIWPQWIRYRPVHVHLLLLGFMACTIFGVGYHIIPRFQGHAIIPRGWAMLHVHVTAWGLLAMLIGWISERSMEGKGLYHLVAFGGLAEIIGVFIFIVIIWRGLVPVKKRAERS